MKTEDWEKDYSGLERLRTVKSEKVYAYVKTAKKLGIRLETKAINPGLYEVLVLPKEDLTFFWKELKANL